MATSEEFAFRPIHDDNLFNHGARVKGKVVLITGAAAGIGREAALRFSEHGGKLVIGDKNISGAQETVNEILKAGREATCKSCDVTVWDDLVDLFEHTINEYGTLDVVVANAGVSEIGQFVVPSFDKQGRLQKPNTATIDINVIGLLYTVHLAQHYLTKDGSSYVIKGDQPPTLKSIVLMGSISSWKGIPLGPLYTASKHAVLGIMRSLHPHLETQGIRISVVHPFFVDTAIVPLPVKFFLAGVPLTPVARVAAAIFYSATDPDVTTNGSAWMLLNDGPVVVVPKEDFKFGVYHAMDLRINAIQGGLDGIVYYFRILKDLARLLHFKSVLAVTVLVGIVGFILKTYQP